MAATQHAQAIKQDSQDYLATALLQLLATKDLSDLTVTAVVRRAGVSRMAFYRNFTTLADVLTAHFTPIITARFDDVLAHVPQAQKLAALGDFFTDLAPTLKLAVTRGFEPVFQQIFTQNMIRFYASISWPAITPVQQKYWTTFMTAGVYQIWRDWLLAGQVESLTTIHELIADFQTGTLQALTARHATDV
ncbi:MAG: TetR family transcriptional regulator [Levilactobacillus sp.]|jgi:AcrR family transcriptional regulator|uniref:TetR/AcrR family transcriptional regulator n=1 Tax=Levilactobacillus sp. TaxID=2767919 RepID=UPI00258CFDD1|nr:TetR family transcriptional regulator [Levilactobacillus sp.]MCI1554346.1 TetR family transcriptional regulator [Levilactobacillus sp.]MCI1599253.1 TetR family transcriptional regulator [Levilactobacillus sp.]MCI1605749.1 TetR family transcriptional regulator [Levilactobacillus sp.]